MITAVITLNTTLHFVFGDLFSNIEILLTRFPIFMMGVYFGRLVMEKKNVSKKEMIIYIVCALIALSFRVVKTSNTLVNSSSLAYWGVYQRYLAALLTIPTCLLLCYGLEFAKTKMMQLFNFFGKHSMEIFLFHMMYRYFFRVSDYKTIIPINELMMIALTILSAMLFSYFYNRPQKKQVAYRYSH
jgi:peptidoglycan/LPS O-acetylase OafA/YrhL